MECAYQIGRDTSTRLFNILKSVLIAAAQKNVNASRPMAA